MSQEELLKEIRVLGNSITKTKKLNPSTPIYSIDKNEVSKWFEKVEDFIQNESPSDFKDKLKRFIIENSSSEINDGDTFQKIRESFLRCFHEPKDKNVL